MCFAENILPTRYEEHYIPQQYPLFHFDHSMKTSRGRTTKGRADLQLKQTIALLNQADSLNRFLKELTRNRFNRAKTKIHGSEFFRGLYSVHSAKAPRIHGPSWRFRWPPRAALSR